MLTYSLRELLHSIHGDDIYLEYDFISDPHKGYSTLPNEEQDLQICSPIASIRNSATMWTTQ